MKKRRIRLLSAFLALALVQANLPAVLAQELSNETLQEENEEAAFDFSYEPSEEEISAVDIINEENIVQENTEIFAEESSLQE